MNNTLNVLKKVSGRSKHFPRLKHHGLIKKLVFGIDGFSEEERDPEWTNRPFIIINHEHVLLSSMIAFSENGCLPVDLTLHAGLGMALCLAALHRAGFIHRYVTPHSFSYPVPLTLDLLSSRMIITDMSLCMEFPYKNGPRVTVPFVGCERYSSIRTHLEREQGPADDYISLIYVMSEMINGKLPWRSIYDRNLIRDTKTDYKDTQDFKRLPREIRKLYHDLILKKMSWIDPEMVIGAFKACILRRDPNKGFELPKWLVMPSSN
uniref:Protein kinase domain-containing protein n=1 Tax=Panagrolaimus superbus TaxID=310955 RepID=A0A914Y6X6_9BILA